MNTEQTSKNIFTYIKTAISFSTHLVAHIETAIAIAANTEKKYFAVSEVGDPWNSKSKNNCLKTTISKFLFRRK